ncbi:MAG: YbaN family protein [bacterium]|nr:YbaN family protein [bacterium]MDE0287341.1 YbaN family protein [bacterium]MDE0439160.1 YbaN family protein [bacterium]
MAGLVRNRALRVLLMGLGLLFVGIGFVGAFVPLIPTTGPVLLAAFLFSISSVRFDHWLTNHRIFGPVVQDWRAGRGFTMRLKMTAVVAIAVTFTITVGFAIDSTVVRVLLIGLAIGLVVYILQLPTKHPESAAATPDP